MSYRLHLKHHQRLALVRNERHAVLPVPSRFRAARRWGVVLLKCLALGAAGAAGGAVLWVAIDIFWRTVSGGAW